MAAKMYDLLGDSNDPERIQLMVYEDGRMFLSTKLGALPIDRQGLVKLGARCTGAGMGLALNQIIGGGTAPPPERPPGGPDPKSN